MNLEELRAKLASLAEQARGIQAAADSASRELSDEEGKAIDGLLAEHAKLSVEVERRTKLENASASDAKPRPLVNRVPGDIAPAIVRPGNYGFRDGNEYLRAIIGRAGGRSDARLMAATTFMSEGDGTSGYAIPPDFRAGIVKMLTAPESLLPRLTSLFTASNQVSLPVSETPPWATTGINPVVVAEGGTIAETKPILKYLTIAMSKYAAIVPVTEEMIEDGTDIQSFVDSESGDVLQTKVNLAILAAALASPAKVTVAKASGAAAGSAVTLANITAMFNAIPPAWQSTAVVVANPAYRVSLLTLNNVGSGGYPVYIRGNSLANAPLDTILGMPIIFSPLAAAVGTEGDFMVVSLAQFYALQKTQGVRSDWSPYYAWAQDIQAFRVALRVGIKSKWSATFADLGGNTYGNVATTATRS